MSGISFDNVFFQNSLSVINLRVCS